MSYNLSLCLYACIQNELLTIEQMKYIQRNGCSHTASHIGNFVLQKMLQCIISTQAYIIQQ